MLTVLSLTEQTSKDKKWLCKCDCGNEKEIWGRALKSGGTGSCGCHRKKILDHTTHGMSNTRIFRTWASMNKRCTNKNIECYKNYGGRGIKVCDEWKDFYNFMLWAYSNGYRDELPAKQCTLDRIDNNGNYEPSNCRWVSYKVQANNKRNNVYYDYQGKRHTISEWAEIKGIKKATLKNRISNLGWDIKKTLETPVRGKAV